MRLLIDIPFSGIIPFGGSQYGFVVAGTFVAGSDILRFFPNL
jgi:hypothetical protein